MRPLLKWPGGKRWLAPHVRASYDACGRPRFVEPFAGGLAVSLNLRPENALINDINPHLINLYSQVKGGNLKYPPAIPNEEQAYLNCREEFNSLIRSNQENSLRAAELFYYLTRRGFNGLCRFNLKGEFNVPFGDMGSNYPVRDFTHYKKVFERWDFYCGDFSELKINSTDYLYADPPYDQTFTGYSKGGFSWDDQVRLAHWCSKHEGPLVISNSYTPRIVELYGDLGFKTVCRQAPRAISRNSDGRGSVAEVVATRNVYLEFYDGTPNLLFSA